MQPVLKKLDTEHKNIAKLLSLFDQQVQHLRDGASTDLALLSNILHYMAFYADVAHHPLENLVFERLLIADSGAADLVEELLEEHLKLSHVEQELAELLAEAGNPTARLDQILNLSAGYLALMRNHMNKKEAKLFSRVEQALTAQDWDEIHAAAQIIDPLFGEKVAEQYRELSNQLQP
jgi:hemerythrin-like domain-containing protein